jgi:glycosyltransferase involved in cell wall biosynthesis
LKIIQVCSRIYPSFMGGVEKVVWSLSNRLSSEFEIEIYSTNPQLKSKTQRMVNDLKITEFPSLATGNVFCFSPGLYKDLAKGNADLIHAHGCQAFPTVASALAKTRNKSPLIVTPHFGANQVPFLFSDFYNYTVNPFVFKKADAIVVVSHSEAFRIEKVGDFREKMFHIPNGVDFQEIDKCIKESVQHESPKEILFVGRLERGKGPHLLVEAFSKIAKDHKVVLTIVGDGPLKGQLLQMIKTYGLNEKIRFLGRLPEEELLKVYANSHIFVLPSSYESHSMSLTEAMSFGLVPVVTNVGGNPAIINPLDNGYLLSWPPSSKEIVSILSNLIEDDKLLKQMGEKARIKARKDFDIENNLKRLCKLYRQWS